MAKIYLTQTALEIALTGNILKDDRKYHTRKCFTVESYTMAEIDADDFNRLPFKHQIEPCSHCTDGAWEAYYYPEKQIEAEFKEYIELFGEGSYYN